MTSCAGQQWKGGSFLTCSISGVSVTCRAPSSDCPQPASSFYAEVMMTQTSFMLLSFVSSIDLAGVFFVFLFFVLNLFNKL